MKHALVWMASALVSCAALAGNTPKTAGATPAAPATITVPPGGHVEAERKRGWMWTPRKDSLNPDSGKRNHVFYVGDPIAFKLGLSATTYEVRDYWGTMVDKGPAGASIHVKVTQPGWYKLYVYGKTATKEWGDVVGGTTFCIFRKNANFPAMPPPGTMGEGTIEDEVVRGVTGMGPQRWPVDASNPEESIKRIEDGISIDKKMYLASDPVRKRALMIAFPGGTKNHLDGVRKIVEHFKDTVKYYEPRNEPNFGSSGKDFAGQEMKPFYELIKSIDPTLKVMGPGTVSIDAGLLAWNEDFLKAGGGKYIDAFSFHCYNMVNGDMNLCRLSMDGVQALLEKYGLGKIEKWQTEQGFPAAMYGVYSPRRQGRWTMLEMMVYEQYGIPKEHNHLWYDRSHGFWDVPHWWENDDGGLNPVAPMMRVWSEELFGRTFSKAFDFGPNGKQLYVGSQFEGDNGSVAAFMSSGATDGKIDLTVKGGESLRIVSAFGVESALPVKAGKATLPVSEIPVYVELANGQSIDVVPLNWGPNLALQPGVTGASSGTGEHPVDKKIKQDISMLFNGKLETWYYGGVDNWYDNTPTFPAWVEIRLPAPASIDRVVIYSGVPWSWRGPILDYELQYDKNGKWETIEHVKEDPRTYGVFTPPARCTVDSFFSERCVFLHQFAPVTTQKIRLYVYEATYGGGSNKTFDEATGQGPHQVQLREIEIYGK